MFNPPAFRSHLELDYLDVMVHNELLRYYLVKIYQKRHIKSLEWPNIFDGIPLGESFVFVINRRTI